MNAKELVCLAAKYADEKKAENIKIIDLEGLSSLCDYVLIATANSKPHLDSIEEEISTQLKKEGVYKSNRDGADSSTWRVSDYGSVLVHIMTPDARNFYALDKIFSFGKDVNFQEPQKKAPKAKKTALKKAPAKKAIVKKGSVKKTPAKKTLVKKTVTKKTTIKKTVAKKAPLKKTAVKKPTVKKAAIKKTSAKKTAVKKTAAKTAPAKKSIIKKNVKKTAKK